MEVSYFATFRDITHEYAYRPSESPSTMGGLLDVLCKRYGKTFRSAVYEGEELSPFVILLVNGRNVRHTGGLETRVGPGDVISVFPMVAGG